MLKETLLLILLMGQITAFSQNQKEVDSLLQVVEIAQDSVKADIYLDLAIAYRTLEIDKAYQYAQLGLNFAKEENLPELMADAHNILGSIYTVLGDFEKANEQLMEALKLNELLGRNRGVANSANSLGILYFNQKDYKNALKYYTKAYQIVDTNAYSGGFATFSLNIGEVNQVLGEYDQARPLLLKALRIFKEIDDQEGIAYSYGILSKISLAEKNYAQALDLCQKSLMFFDLDQNELGKVEYYIFLSDIYASQGKYALAQENAQTALRLASQLNATQWIMNSHEQLAQLYKNKNSFELAYYHIDTAKELRTLLLDEKGMRQINNMRIIYETDQVLQENKLLKINSELNEITISEQKTLNLVIAVFLLALAIFAFYIYRANRIKQRTNGILRIQNEEIRQQREEILTQAEGLKYINREVVRKNELIQKKNKDLTDSLNYAKRIQAALLPFRERISNSLPEHFILYKPKDIVSGDFYWFGEYEQKVIIAVADCTGHGIPGAFMSFIGHDMLNYICNIKRVFAPDEILSEMKNNVITVLRQEENDNRDGLEISICVWDKEKNEVEFAGANHSLIYIQNESIHHIKGDRTTIGMDERTDNVQFTNHKISIDGDTSFYLYTDGYVDQFGGPDDKKFMVAPFKELILRNNLKQMNTQGQIISDTLEEWMVDADQVDDILVLGFRLFD